MAMQEHKIDAKNRPLGRLASEIAVILRDKNKPSFTPHIMGNTKVIVTNIEKMEMTGKKATDKIYRHYSGYHGGLKTIYAKNLTKQDILKRAVWGMLPTNRHRQHLIKNLCFE